MTRIRSTTTFVVFFASVCVGSYLISDYYMDDSWPEAFGQSCGKSLEDDSLYLNSHLNSLGILKYGKNIDCTVQLNSGDQPGSRYKLKFKWFELEYHYQCAYDSLTIYDSEMSTIASSTPIDTFCGDKEPNMTGYPTQQYMTFKFRTDGGTGKKGFRILATRTIPAYQEPDVPCLKDYFHCKAENRCIDGRLQCDGTNHCDDNSDEEGCSSWEKFIGSLLALGVSGLVGVGFLVILGCTSICVIICVCTCCKKCCKACCCKLCKKTGNLPKNKIDVGNNAELEVVKTEAETKSPEANKTKDSPKAVPAKSAQTGVQTGVNPTQGVSPTKPVQADDQPSVGEEKKVNAPRPTSALQQAADDNITKID